LRLKVGWYDMLCKEHHWLIVHYIFSSTVFFCDEQVAILASSRKPVDISIAYCISASVEMTQWEEN